jgi:hypothetical protein
MPPHLVAIARDGGKLARPESDRIGGIRLNGPKTNAKHGRKSQKRTPAGDSVKRAPQE